MKSWSHAGTGKRGTCPPPLWKCCTVILCISSYSKTLSIEECICIIFTTCRRLLGALLPDPYRGSIPAPQWGTFVPKPLICPPLEKILQAPMNEISHIHHTSGHCRKGVQDQRSKVTIMTRPINL